MFQLNTNDPQSLTKYLKKRKWLLPAEQICALSKPGEGNMNYVLRIETGRRTFILKQSRAYVEKFPHIPAPANRAIIEGTFYQTIQALPSIQALMPTILGVDKINNIIVLEDLGTANDYTGLYGFQTALSSNEVIALINYLNLLHGHFRKPKGSRKMGNMAMRKLNHEHIFHYPFVAENGFDLDLIQPGLQALAMTYKTDMTLKRIVHNIGKIYLGTGDTLLHGDYYPGSWLRTLHGIKIIDPEFCFYGPKEFDVAVMLAHFYMTAQNEDVMESISVNYKLYPSLNSQLLYSFIGVEMMRRLIGLAHVPLACDLNRKKELLEKAYTFLTQ
ncbi:MAG: phosphotransferase [Saprospiraceae bacterium]|nr:phosphotransferase [Saprospiraceae bacterium]